MFNIKTSSVFLGEYIGIVEWIDINRSSCFKRCSMYRSSHKQALKDANKLKQELIYKLINIQNKDK